MLEEKQDMQMVFHMSFGSDFGKKHFAKILDEHSSSLSTQALSADKCVMWSILSNSEHET